MAWKWKVWVPGPTDDGCTVSRYRTRGFSPGTNTGAPGSPAHTSKTTKWLASPEKKASLVTIIREPSNCTLDGSSNGTGLPLSPDVSAGKRPSSLPVWLSSTIWFVCGPTSARYTWPERATANPSGPSFGPLSQIWRSTPGLPFGLIGSL